MMKLMVRGNQNKKISQSSFICLILKNPNISAFVILFFGFFLLRFIRIQGEGSFIEKDEEQQKVQV